jgi:hypothetical protein
MTISSVSFLITRCLSFASEDPSTSLASASPSRGGSEGVGFVASAEAVWAAWAGVAPAAEVVVDMYDDWTTGRPEKLRSE